jgi:hypothetical protein
MEARYLYRIVFAILNVVHRDYEAPFPSLYLDRPFCLRNLIPISPFLPSPFRARRENLIARLVAIIVPREKPVAH